MCYHKKLALENLAIKLILLFPITTLLQRYSLFDDINKILISIITFLLITLIGRITYKTLFVLLFSLFLFIMTLIYTQFDIKYINNYVFLPIWILYFIYTKSNLDKINEILQRNITFVKVIINLWMLVATGFLLIILTHGPISNNSVYTDHRAASTCLFILILIWIYIVLTRHRHAFLLCLIPMFYTLIMGARTYLLVNAIVFACIYYYCCNNKRTFYLTLVPCTLIFIYTITISPMMSKINFSLQENVVLDFWGMLTSGRTVFFKIDMEAFFSLPIWNQIVGNGLLYVHKINEDFLGTPLWAHNDYINILLGNGYGGLFVYFSVFIDFCRVSFAKSRTKFYIYSFLLACFINAMLNGLYIYTCAMLAMPFMMIAAILSKEVGSIHPDVPIKAQ